MAEISICSDFGAQKNKVTVSPSISHEVMGPDFQHRDDKVSSERINNLLEFLWLERQSKGSRDHHLWLHTQCAAGVMLMVGVSALNKRPLENKTSLLTPRHTPTPLAPEE